MDSSTPWYMQAGDTLGLPGMAAGGTSALKYLLPAMRNYGAKAVGSLAGGPFTAAMTAAQVMDPTAANGGEQPWYIRDPQSGQMIPNPAKKFDSSMVPQRPESPPVPGSAPILQTGAFTGGSGGAPTSAPGVGGIGSDQSQVPWKMATTPAPTPTQPAPAQTAPPAPPPQSGPDMSIASQSGNAQPTQSNQANAQSLLQKLFGSPGALSGAQANPNSAAAPMSFGQQQGQGGSSQGLFGKAFNDFNQLQGMFGGGSSPVGVVGGAGGLSVPTFF